ncbi:MAG: hypothetical protein BGO49_07165 [Planctomycetales bacterium 71-10]|nr:MAG: hypothetical protein BGO49_07165 [Planctomycetales bacterium 71-10]
MCRIVGVAALARAGLFRHESGARSATIDAPDPCDPSEPAGLLVEVEVHDRDAARVTIDGQVVEACARPGIGGGLFWGFLRPGCGRPVRHLYRPSGGDAYRCGECWAVARPGRDARPGLAAEGLARRVAALVADGTRAARAAREEVVG